MSFHFSALFLALIIDAIIGDPDWLWRKASHPVVWMGHIISKLDERFNISSDSQKQRRQKGLYTLVFLIVLGAGFGFLLQFLIGDLALSWVVEAVVVAIFLSSRSLYDHVARVAGKLENTDLDEARVAVGQIVGRDPKTLDQSGVARAAIESLAENFSDGVVAPAFWYLVAGLPGLIIYKMINTADSMIGHKTSRHLDFGRATARLDDFVNLLPSRITALLCVLAFAFHHGIRAARNAWRTVGEDAAKHRSPNAGWPEAAMAGGLDIALSGPRTYEGKSDNEPWINQNGCQQIDHNDIKMALRLYATGVLILAVVVGFYGIVI